MAKDYTTLAKEVVKAVGGKSNVISVSNCMTRLRFVLKDDSIPNEDEVRAIKGVAGVMNQGGQYQVIIGTHVTNVLPFVKKELDMSSDVSVMDEGKKMAENMRVIKKDSPINKFFKMIQGCLMPLIGPMCAVGILKGILAILTTIGVLASTDGTYVILYNAADAFMLFLPIFVGFSAAKVFNCSQMTSMAVCAAMLSPTLISTIGGETALTFLRIPVFMINYQNSFFPAMAAVWLASKVEKLAKKVLPEMFHLMFVPMFAIVITVPAVLIVIGPIITLISDFVANGIVGLVGISPMIAGLIIGALWQLIVLTGLHGAMIPIIINNIITLGADPLNSILTMTVFAVTGVAFGYGLKVKDKEEKSMAFTNVVSGMFGVTEPIIYTIALPKFKNFICAFIGGGISGALLGIFNVQFYTFAGSGVFALPGMISSEGVGMNFYVACIGAVVAFGVSAILAYIVNERE